MNSPAPFEPLLLTPSEVANALKVCRSKSYQLIAAGTIPSVRIGGSVRVPAEALRAWVARQCAERAEDGR